MNTLILDEKTYRDKLYGGWLGKNIGGTFGVPMEGNKEMNNVTFYTSLPEGPAANDDLEMQLVWLHALEQYGVKLTAKELGREWLDHILGCADEYGYCLANLRKGLQPPVSGWFGNPFIDCMGSPIRSEIWAFISPGAPEIACYYAYQDAIVDHAGGEGVPGEMFLAALESAAFVEKNIQRLLDIGLSYIPADCRVALAVRDIRRWHKEGRDWKEARAFILEKHGGVNFTDAPQNIAFIVLGLLYGVSFGDSLIKAVNCGYDTDCTGATLGAILGVLHGASGIPKEWIAPIGDRIVVSSYVRNFDAPEKLEELVERNVKLAKRVIAEWDLPVLMMDTSLLAESVKKAGPDMLVQGILEPARLLENDHKVNKFFIPGDRRTSPVFEIEVKYGEDGPFIGRNFSKTLTFVLVNQSPDTVCGWLELDVPPGWEKPEAREYSLCPGDKTVWEAVVRSNDVMEFQYGLALNLFRKYDACVWDKSTVPFALAPAAHWKVENPEGEVMEVVCSNFCMRLDKDFKKVVKGVYKARTSMFNPQDRKIKLICGTASPLKVKLNGKTVMEDMQFTECIPSFYPMPREQRAIGQKEALLMIPQGVHALELELIRGDSPLEVYVAPVSDYEVHNYCFIDVLFC